MKKDPRVNIGMFTFNEEKHLREAIDSLLKQTYKNFKLIIVDDCSTDSTEKIILDYLVKDQRVEYSRNRVRSGYGMNYRITYGMKEKQAKYFAWAAGHDKHHHDWLKTLVTIMEKDSDVALAYPLTVRISADGKDLQVKPPLFEALSSETSERIKRVSFNAEGFGNMIYGLFRIDFLDKIESFPLVLLPDTVFLTELSLKGLFYQVKHKLWYRRFVGLFSLDRQKKNIFQSVPWYIKLPYPIVNSTAIIFRTVFSLRPFTPKERYLGLKLGWYYYLDNILALEKYYPSMKVLFSAYRKARNIIKHKWLLIEATYERLKK